MGNVIEKFRNFLKGSPTSAESAKERTKAGIQRDRQEIQGDEPENS